MNGIIIADKPAGWTSHDVVAKLRNVLQIKRVGHGGTLDPIATGVLPIFIGRATRAAEFCVGADKEYVAGLKLGLVTDTQDITGNTISACEVSISAKELTDIIKCFLGNQKQIPPMYSAVKVGGKKLYEIARRGGDIERAPRDVFISDIELIEGDGSDFLLRIVCSKGTYIRTLCNDIGASLGCGGTMSSLRRIRAGSFTEDKAHTLEEMLDAVSAGETEKIIIPVDSVFSEFPAITLNEAEARKCKNGAPSYQTRTDLEGKYRFYGPNGEFLMLGEVKSGIIRTIKNFYEIRK